MQHAQFTFDLFFGDSTTPLVAGPTPAILPIVNSTVPVDKDSGEGIGVAVDAKPPAAQDLATHAASTPRGHASATAVAMKEAARTPLMDKVGKM